MNRWLTIDTEDRVTLKFATDWWGMVFWLAYVGVLVLAPNF